MAQPYVRGPILIYCGVGGSPTFLGTGERAPRYSLRRSWERVMNDLSGTQIPYDYSYQGCEAFVTCKLTRWNQSVLNNVQDVVSGSAAAGIMGPGEVGTLMNTEGVAQPLWLQYGYGPGGFAAKPAMSGLPGGYKFFSAWLEGPDEHEGGTDPASVTLTWHCVRVPGAQYGQFNLFNTDMSGLPSPN